MALQMGRPVVLFHTTVVSRWLVMPMAAMSAAEAPALRRASRATSSCVEKISSASCSTQPGWGKIWVNSFWAILMIWPWASNKMQRLLVVPESRDMMYCAI